MYQIDDLIQLSALQHLAFCPRQCALIHNEQVWSESVLTAEGRLMHDRVHDEKRESRRDVRFEFGVPLRSLELGLIGKADVIEFHRSAKGSWMPFPVEYKRGKPKEHDSDKVQLCAQALCLEEMLGVHIEEGALFYGRIRRRLDVLFDSSLRAQTHETVRKAHELLSSGKTPPPVYSKRCDNCSLVDACLPKAVQKKRTVKSYVSRMVKEP